MILKLSKEQKQQQMLLLEADKRFNVLLDPESKHKLQIVGFHEKKGYLEALETKGPLLEGVGTYAAAKGQVPCAHVTHSVVRLFEWTA